MIKLRVYGMPAPQGSKWSPRNSHAILDNDAAGVRSWREAVKVAALRAPVQHTPARAIAGEAVHADLTFIFPRPLAHYGTGSNRDKLKPSAPMWPTGRKWDVDKLARSTLDALTDARVWGDDGQVVQLKVQKVWAAPAERPGAVIEIYWTGADQ